MKTTSPKTETFRDCVVLNEETGLRVYYDLDAKETAWFTSIAAAFDMSIAEFRKAKQQGTLPNPFPKRESDHSAAYDAFKIECTDPKLQTLFEIAAKYHEQSVRTYIVDSIFGDLEAFSEDLVVHPRTGAVLAEWWDLHDLEFRTNTEGEPPACTDVPGRIWQRGNRFNYDKSNLVDRRMGELESALGDTVGADILQGVIKDILKGDYGLARQYDDEPAAEAILAGLRDKWRAEDAVPAAERAAEEVAR